VSVITEFRSVRKISEERKDVGALVFFLVVAVGEEEWRGGRMGCAVKDRIGTCKYK